MINNTTEFDDKTPFIRIFLLVLAICFLVLFQIEAQSKHDTRAYWVSTMTKIADPVLNNLSKETLKQNMPVRFGNVDRTSVTHLEAFGRLLAGIAPWLELGADETDEGKLRLRYIELSRKCITNSVNPESPDFLNFNQGNQPLVDTAFMAHGLLRAYNQLWLPLDEMTKTNVLKAFKSSRVIIKKGNNWELFTAMVEAFILKVEGSCELDQIESALQHHEDWYKGGGYYGDGPHFVWDYYNSYVIQPMLLDISKVMVEKGIKTEKHYQKYLGRAIRYALVQEHFISPEGTYPPLGRSLAYRFGAFQTLAQVALEKELPESIKPEQVRSALSEVIYRSIEAPNTFDEEGWLHIGIVGHQPGIGERYISTGSLYLCSVGMLPLGLPASNPFWSEPAANWTSKKVWKGLDVKSSFRKK
ncbi:DUF2264 domain-containing protein [Cognatitamlana onchidii]|uniref:DUF2264 domain-containing protein n=1 Tax=Cognatitamlana onchidii TaxID=2562860 RepID=UPI0010A67D87|nr:DUF2264 domain-containing protein [Algibacter onchidii]